MIRKTSVTLYMNRVDDISHHQVIAFDVLVSRSGMRLIPAESTNIDTTHAQTLEVELIVKCIYICKSHLSVCLRSPLHMDI